MTQKDVSEQENVKEGLTIAVRSLASRQKQSAATTGEKNHFFGRHHTEETKRKISLAKMGVSVPLKGPAPPRGAGTGGFNRKVECEYCAQVIAVANRERHQAACPLNPNNSRLCKHCGGAVLAPRKYNPVFCSRRCQMEHRIATNPKRTKSCCICGKDVHIDSTRHGYFRKTCSPVCLSLLIGRNSSGNPNCGAKAHFIGSRRLQYGGVQMDSTWEVELASWMDQQDITWIRTRSGYFLWTDAAGRQRRYTPDFYLADLDCYLDPKNDYLMKVDAQKLAEVRKQHGIKLITGRLKSVKAEVKRLQKRMAKAPVA